MDIVSVNFSAMLYIDVAFMWFCAVEESRVHFARVRVKFCSVQLHCFSKQ